MQINNNDFFHFLKNNTHTYIVYRAPPHIFWFRRFGVRPAFLISFSGNAYQGIPFEDLGIE